MIQFHISFFISSDYLFIKLFAVVSFVFFYSDVSDHWLWNLEGIYSLVFETNDVVPYQMSNQNLECRVLFVSDFTKFNCDIIYNITTSLFQILFILPCPP